MASDLTFALAAAGFFVAAFAFLTSLAALIETRETISQTEQGEYLYTIFCHHVILIFDKIAENRSN